MFSTARHKLELRLRQPRYVGTRHAGLCNRHRSRRRCRQSSIVSQKNFLHFHRLIVVGVNLLSRLNKNRFVNSTVETLPFDRIGFNTNG